MSANLVYQSGYEIGSTTPSGEANEDHNMMIVMPWWWSSALTWKEEREKQKAQGKGISGRSQFVFGDQDT